MKDTDILADKLEAAIGKTFTQFAQWDSGMCSYALLHNPKKSQAWIIVLFFNDQPTLRNALVHGACYAIYQFLHNECVAIDKEQLITIRFDAGKYPQNRAEYDQLFDKHTAAYDILKNEKGEQQICSQCGHDWSKHKLSGYVTDGNPTPIEGWMICPADDCTCFLTWDIPAMKNFQQSKVRPSGRPAPPLDSGIRTPA